MTADIIPIEPHIRHALCGDLAAHFLRQAGHLLIVGSADVTGTRALALETLGDMVIQMANRVQAEFRVLPRPLVLLDDGADALPCDVEAAT